MVTITTGNGSYGINGSKNSETLLDALHNARVFTLSSEPDGRVRITEACDDYFFALLTSEQVRALARELLALVE
jgi:hypothetical protein